MNWRRVIAAVCALSLIPLFSGEEGIRQAAGPAQVEVGSPPLVALTFDDGPRNKTTGALLDGLALREVPATFFLVGSRIAGSEELIRRMAAEGHQIGVHTYDHVIVTDLSREDFDLQVGKTRAQLIDILGEYDVKATFFIVGKRAETRKYLIKRQFDEGHTVAVHSYSHEYDNIYKNTKTLIYDII